MTYWISAKTCDEGPTEHVMDFVEALDFDQARAILDGRCRLRWGGRTWRHTSVTEQPDESGPVALTVDLAAAHRASGLLPRGAGRVE